MQKNLILFLILIMVVCLCGCTSHRSSNTKINSANTERINKIKNEYKTTAKTTNNTSTTYTYNDDVLKINMY